jgi:hypothetical protein
MLRTQGGVETVGLPRAVQGPHVQLLGQSVPALFHVVALLPVLLVALLRAVDVLHAWTPHRRAELVAL